MNTIALIDSPLFSRAIKWTPRVIVIGLGAYYGLGIAYEIGLMASVDKLAIAILKQSVGYAGIGFFMPTIQWYAAVGVRVIIGGLGGLAYDLCERVVTHVYILFSSLVPRSDVRECLPEGNGDHIV